MIRHIVALDSKRGIAKDGAMPRWNLSQDQAYFNKMTLQKGATVLMGKQTFIEALRNRPLKDRTNYVVTHDTAPITGAIIINDLEQFMRDWPAGKDLWIIGGAGIFEQTMDAADELYITEIDGDFACDRFYPPYLEGHRLNSRSEPITEHGTSYTFCIYRSKP